MDNLEIDDIFGDSDEDPKKKVNGKKKGNRVELELCKKLTKHFGDTFSRSVGSGNRWGQVASMPKHAKDTLLGDLCSPENFKWVIECKGGYDNDVDFSSVMDAGCSRIDEFIKQSEHDAQESGRLPIIMWKRSRKPWVAIVRSTDIDVSQITHYMRYNNWIAVSLDKLLSLTSKEYWYAT